MQSKFAIGIDIGATRTKIGLVQAPSRLVKHQTISSHLDGPGPEQFLAGVEPVVERYLAAYPIAGIGISLCSLVDDARTGSLLSVNAPALNHWNINAYFRGRFGRPVLLGNDVAAHALAEYRFGAGQGVERMLCLALGTGLAAACISNGSVLETWGCVSADAGRVILQPDAAVACNAGVVGSAEALCGKSHIERLARRAYQRENISARGVISAARKGDPIAVEVMAEIGRSVGHLLAILSPVFFPQRIVITGGTAEAGEGFFHAIRSRYDELIGAYMAFLGGLTTGTPRPVEIVKGRLGPGAAILGTVAGFFPGEEPEPRPESSG